jgi:hypothetical protein
MTLEEIFAARVQAAIVAGDELGYYPSILVGMLKDCSAVSVAVKLVSASEVKYGFLQIVDLGRVDLTLEAIMLEPQFAPLFRASVLEVARFRLNNIDQLRRIA